MTIDTGYRKGGGDISNLLPSFSKIAANGQELMADSPSDTLNIIAGTGVILSLNETNDTMTISAAVEVGGSADWLQVSGTPTTLAGYGITDAAPLSHVHSDVAPLSHVHSDAVFLGGTNTFTAANLFPAGATIGALAVPAEGSPDVPTIGGFRIWHYGNDGTGSGMDADTVDGKHAEDFVSITSSVNFALATDIYTKTEVDALIPTGIALAANVYTKAEVDALIPTDIVLAADVYTKTEINALIPAALAANVYTKDEVYTKGEVNALDTASILNSTHEIYGALTFVFDGGLTAITAGMTATLVVPYACRLKGAYITASPTGDMVFDVWRVDAVGGWLPTAANSILPVEKMTLPSWAEIWADDWLVGWEVDIPQFSVVTVSVVSCTNVRQATVALIHTHMIIPQLMG